MKHIITAASILLIAATSLAADKTAEGKHYSFKTPPGAAFVSSNGGNSYTFTWGKAAKTATLAIHQSPAAMTPEQFKVFAKQISDLYNNQAKNPPQGMPKARIKESQVTVGPFKGTQIVTTMRMPDGTVLQQYSLPIYDGEFALNVQLTPNSEKDLAKALKILRSAKKTAKK